MVEPDLKFIKDLGILGGEDLKKCYQCATCSVVCPISPGQQALPAQGDDRGVLGSEGQGGQERGPVAVPQLRRLLDALPAQGQAGRRAGRDPRPGHRRVLAAALAGRGGQRPQEAADPARDPGRLSILVMGSITGHDLQLQVPDLSPEGTSRTTSSSPPGWWTSHMVPAMLFAVTVFALATEALRLATSTRTPWPRARPTSRPSRPAGFVQALIRVDPDHHDGTRSSPSAPRTRTATSPTC
ncbi:MAG: hypothetical protein MZU95_00985 [Desulfomicrobium escambiense]|nr:hypothetical protein [Desulfomicrobium escambiense]